MQAYKKLKPYAVASQVAYRLIHSRFPPIALFDDVADADEFEALYKVQALTNPRLLAQAGNASLLPATQIPFGIAGCSYAVAPFTHVNPDGSRFSDGSYGVLYLADAMQTALLEVQHHQQLYWQNVPGLKFERFVFRGLKVEFSVLKNPAAEAGLSAIHFGDEHPIYDANDYSAARSLGREIKQQKPMATLRYKSVRRAGATCWALFSPKHVSSVKQSQHYEMVWDTKTISIARLTQVR